LASAFFARKDLRPVKLMSIPTSVDDTGVCDRLVAKHCHTLPQGLPEMGCCYAIVWQRRDGVVVPIITRGLHKFMDESTQCVFCPNQGYVGRISEALGSIDHEAISNMFFVDPRAFMRKTSAILNGISSVIFIPHATGVLLELGFSKPKDAENSLPCLRTSHALAMEQCVLTEIPSGLSFSREDRNSTAAFRARSPSAFRARSPSPECAPSRQWWPSIGSQGHPLCCQFPCKYVRKRQGCKDGRDCTRCHLCLFSKKGAKNGFNLEYDLKAQAAATTLSTLGATWTAR